MKKNWTLAIGRGGRALAAALVLAVPLLAASCSSAANGGTAAAAGTKDTDGTQVSATQQKVDQAALQSLKESGQAFAAVAREVSPAVVFVKVEKTVQEPGPFGTSGQPGGDDLLRHFFEMPFGQQAPQEEHVMAQGSGFIVSPGGEIITNNHVVSDADNISVTLDDGRTFSAKVVGTDPHSDVAVIKIDAKDLPALKFDNSDKVEVGEWVVAVGNPFGLSESITAGIVSAKGRSSVGIADYEDFIQTDAAINPGNSGGPLIDLDGRVVGMNTAIYSRSGGNMGIGFAIPANMVKAIADQLEEHGTVTRGYMGVVVQELTPELAKTFDSSASKGALVAQVEKDTPAAEAGLERGDLITAVDGKPVTNTGEFRNKIAMTAPGTKIKLDVVRDGKEREVDLTVGKLPDSGNVAMNGTESTHENYGLAVQDLTPELAAQLGLTGQKGVVISQVVPGSLADQAGLRPGDLIVEANRLPVASTEDFAKAVSKLGKGDALLLLVKQGRFAHYVVLGGQ